MCIKILILRKKATQGEEPWVAIKKKKSERCSGIFQESMWFA